MFLGIDICCRYLEVEFLRSAQKSSEVTWVLDDFDQEIWTDKKC